MKYYTKLILILCFLSTSLLVIAQDSAITIVPPTVDTLLQPNGFILSKDSVEALKNSKAFAYLKDIDSLLKATQKEKLAEEANEQLPHSLNWFERILTSSITQYFFWTVGILFVLFVLYKLFFAEGFFQRQSSKTIIKELDKEDDLHADTDYDILITKAIIEQNFRLAVRYLYLQVLQKLSADELIQYSPDKTNYQYVHELSNQYKNNFSALTLQYEYVWYGKFEINETIFSSMQNRFKKFIDQL